MTLSTIIGKSIKKIVPSYCTVFLRSLELKARLFLNYSQISRIRELVDKRPLILKIETVNICNARCVFCAYRKMEREKKVLPLELFEKIIREYSEIGGGAVSLTPIAGDPLLDPYLIKRYEILKKFKNIHQISFTTNGIAFTNYSEKELEFILRESFLIQFSIGGLDREVYKSLYGVDKLDDVLSSLLRVLKIKKRTASQVNTYITFRTNAPDFKNTYFKKLEVFKQEGIMESYFQSISSYHNYGGKINSNELKNVSIADGGLRAKSVACALPLIHMTVCSNGKITNCGCVDINGSCLVIGDSSKDTIDECWKSEKRIALLNSFSKKGIPKLCKQCSAYRPNNRFFSTGVFKKIQSYNKIPIEFYLDFFGG